VAPLTNHLLLWLDASTLQQTNLAPVKSLPDFEPEEEQPRFCSECADL